MEFEIPFMVTDLHQRNVERIIQYEHTMHPNYVLKFGIQICEAMEYVHAAGVIHRDMKPGNALVTGETLVVGDFGLAKTSTEAGEDRFYRDDLTGYDETIGPVMWMSPELLRYSKDKSYPVDHRSDIFQIGSILWYMLTGENPRGVIDEDDDPSGGKFFPSVQRTQHRKPEKRYQTVAELKADLAGINLE